MTHLATLVLAAAPSDEIRALHDALTANRYAGPLVGAGSEVLAAVTESRPDVVILGPGLSDDMPVADLMARLRALPQGRDMLVVVLSDHPLAAVGDALLGCGVDDVVAWPCPVSVVLAHVRPLMRVATMQSEHRLRSRLLEVPDAAAVHGGAVAEPPARILVIGQASDAAKVAQALGEEARISQTDDLFDAQSQLEARPYDAVVLVGRDDSEAPLELCLQIRRNHRLFNLPVLFLTGDAQGADPARPYAMGASSVLPVAAAEADIRVALLANVRRQRRRWALRRALDTTLIEATRDGSAPVVYGSQALGRYLPGRVQATQQAGRTLSVIGFGFAGVDAIRREFGPEAEANLLDQLGQWLTLLVRAEDFVARQSGSRFVVTLPDTPLSEAQVVMHRIAAVVSTTDFAVTDVYRVVKVWAAVNAAELTGQEDEQGLLGRAMDLSGLDDLAGA